MASYAEEPEPAPLQVVSVQPCELGALLGEVPPTAVTYGEEAGQETS
ncbi:hypothetical protein [Streptomyces sp. NPDC002676]